MAKSFSSLKPQRLGLIDKMPFGKFKDCRICDCLEDGYEYFLWVNSVKPELLSKDVLEECAQFKLNQAVAEEADNNKAILNMNPWSFSDMEDDIPF